MRSSSLLPFPRHHDLTFNSIFASAIHLPWAKGGFDIRRHPTTNFKQIFPPLLLSSSSQNDLLKTFIDLENQITRKNFETFWDRAKEISVKESYTDLFLSLTEKNNNNSTHLPASLFLLQDEVENIKRFFEKELFVNCENENSMIQNQQPKFWLHCSSFHQTYQVMNAISKLNTRREKNQFGICIPFPGTNLCGKILFGMENRQEQDQGQNFQRNEKENSSSNEETQEQELSPFEIDIVETLNSCAMENIPTSIWLVSGLSCPFGGVMQLDPVEIGDLIVNFCDGYRCSQIFCDDTAGTITGRQLETWMKTISAVSASADSGGDEFLRKISFCFRTQNDNKSLFFTQQQSEEDKNSATQQFVHHEVFDRIYRCHSHLIGFSPSSLQNYCGIFPHRYSSSSNNNNTFVPHSCFVDWTVDFISNEYIKSDPYGRETSLEAQQRLIEVETSCVEQVKLIRSIGEDGIF